VRAESSWARGASPLIERGVLGELSSVLHVYRGFQDIPGSWFVKMEHSNILDHGIHYIDLVRYFTGRTIRASLPRLIICKPPGNRVTGWASD
jgi:predicted dehydrogenase